jgi:hypothetical protein
MNAACLETLSPILNLTQHHPDHGGLLGNDAIAQFFEVDSGSIRTLKKRLTDESAISEGQHWLKGESNKTLWTFRGFIRLGMRLSSPMALQLQQHLEDLLAMLNAGQVQIIPVDGQSVGIQLVTVEAVAGELVPVPLAHEPVVSDEQVWAIARPIAAAVYEKRQANRSSLEARVNDAIAAELQQLEAQAEPLGKSIALQWGLPLETVTPIIQGAA